MRPFTFTLHAAREDVHDRIAGRPGDFANTVRELTDAAAAGLSVGVRVPVHYRTFGLLADTIELAADRLGLTLPARAVRFAPTTNAALGAAVDAHLAALSAIVAGTPIALDVRREDPLFEIVGRLAGAVGFESDADVLRLFGALTGAAYVGPRVFHVDVSNACNTDCVYCWFHSEYSADRPDAALFDPAWQSRRIDYGLYTRLVDDLVSLRATEDLVLSGKGEPLTHPRLLDMVRYAKARGLAVTLFTNGILLTPEVAAALIDAGLDLLYVSLSAHDAASFAKLHRDPPPDQFDRIVAHCAGLTREKRARGAALPRLVLVSILNRRNAADAVAFARLAERIGADHLRYQLTAIESYNEPLRLSADQLARLKVDLGEARAIAEAAGIDVIANIDFQMAHAATSQDWSGDYFLDAGCFAGWLFSRVWADGTVSFCCVPKPMGKLGETGFAEFWKSARYADLRLDAKDLRAHGDRRMDDDSRLLDARCVRCPNYEQIQWLFDLADRLHVREWLG
jgi:MoaA/NifB/PqqE/SkfB family radical SAM enzyme